MPVQKAQVVAIVIERDGRFLLGKRHPSKKSAPHYWCPPSGGIEAGETQEQAAVREAREELGVKVEPLCKLGELDTHDKKGRMHWWQVRLLEGEPSLANDEHTELRWVSLDEMKRLEPVFPEDYDLFARARTSSVHK